MTLAEAENYPDEELAINFGEVFGNLGGIPVKNAAVDMTAV